MGLLQNELLFAKVRPDAIIPTKREEDAGRDVYACFDEDFIIINRHETKLIPTGIASAFTDKYYIHLSERGSLGSKGIKVSAGIIDSGFRNSWFVAISNVNDVPVLISKLTYEELVLKYGEIDEEGDIKLIHDKMEDYNIWLKIDDDYAIIYPYSKAITQAIVYEVPNMIVSEIDYEDILKIKSERRLGSLGSSSK